MDQQRLNRRNSLFVDHDNEKILLYDLCKKYNISCPISVRRLKMGWDIEKIITVPINHYHTKNIKKNIYDEKISNIYHKNMKQVSLKYYINIELGISIKTAADRIGVSPQYLGVVMAGKRPAGRPLCVKLARWSNGRIDLAPLMMIEKGK